MKRTTKYLYYFLALLMPFGSVNPFSLSSIEGVSGSMGEQMGFAPYLFVICSLLALLDVNVQRLVIRHKRIAVPLFWFLFVFSLSTFLNDEGDRNFPYLFLLKMGIVEFGFYVTVCYYLAYPKHLRPTLLIYAYVCVAIVIAYFLGFLKGFFFVSNGRLWIFGINPNTFSFLMGIGALFIANEFVNPSKRVIYKYVHLLSITLIILYIILSGSRGTFIAVSFCLYFLVLRKMSKKLIVTIPFAIILVGSAISYYESHSERISMFERLSDTGNDERIKLVNESLELFFEQPIFGYGENGYKREMRQRHNEHRDAHNVIITVMGKSGIIGLCVFSAFLYMVAHACWRNRRLSPLSFILFIDVLLMSMKTGGVLSYAMMWYAYGISLALSQVNNNQLQIVKK